MAVNACTIVSEVTDVTVGVAVTVGIADWPITRVVVIVVCLAESGETVKVTGWNVSGP